ncbi:MAG: hypothetical protein ABI162_13210 [Luteolibacter sp.]
MSARNKLYITAAALLLLAVGILLRPSTEHPTAAATVPAERSRSINRETNPPTPPPTPRRAKDFQTTLMKLATESERKLTHQEIDNYVEAQNRSMDSLLSAFRLSGDEAYLKEALEKFPNNPQVLFCALQLSSDPAKRLEMLESFKRADPGNGIGNCLAAGALFDLGKNDEAFAELLRSSGKPITDFTITFYHNDEEAYLTAGFSPVLAKMTTLYTSSKGGFMQMRGITKKLDELRGNYASTGDDAAVQSVRDIQSEMGGHLQEDPTVVGKLVGIAVEKGALKGLDTPEARARWEELDQRQKSLSEKALKIPTLMENPAVPESDWVLYFDRAKLFGENAANDWILGKYPDL